MQAVDEKTSKGFVGVEQTSEREQREQRRIDDKWSPGRQDPRHCFEVSTHKIILKATHGMYAVDQILQKKKKKQKTVGSSRIKSFQEHDLVGNC